MDKESGGVYLILVRVIRHTGFTLLSVTSISVTLLERFPDLIMSRRHTSARI